MHLASCARNRQVFYETPREIPVEFPLDRKRFCDVFDSVFGEGHDVLSEGVSKSLLAA